jgi:hypothetical protein
MPLGSTAGIGRGDVVAAQQYTPMLRVGQSVLGRVINGMGQPIDRKGPLTNTVWRPLMPPPIDPLDRPLIDQPLATGIRAIDALCSVGRGQRLGVFSPPGVGKSTLMGLMARHTSADVTVIALVGERGREVNQFITEHLGEAGLARSVVVCAAGDEPALLRIRAALVAMTVAEYFRDQGLDVLFFMDSLTRFCHAARQVGLAAGEPPATKGYTPGVFSMLPVLLERSGRTRRGSISGFYAVLVEGDELTDPMPDTGWPQHQAAMARVIRGLQSALNQNGGSVTLRLSPPEIGVVRIQLEVTEGVVRAQLWAENVSVQSLLRQQVGHLHNALESHGLTVDRIEVQTIQQNSSSFIPDQTDEQNIEDEGRSRGRYAPDQRRQQHQDHPSPVQTFEQELNVVA